MNTKRFTTKKELEKIVVYSENTNVMYFYEVEEAKKYRERLVKERPFEEIVYKEVYIINKFIWYGR